MAELSSAGKFLANWVEDYLGADPGDGLLIDGSIKRCLADGEIAGISTEELVKAADGCLHQQCPEGEAHLAVASTWRHQCRNKTGPGRDGSACKGLPEIHDAEDKADADGDCPSL